ncbi:long-chain fatty acid transport protein [Neorhizobium galegae]|uniref:OmpP1/FadL family transporter n=1 Tax=Neorhizobium galegae TaxID=399 RepID=UPI001FDAA5B1|nr:OmpP1/FadL family transporter [Neorhizobium galegae]MBP2549074.1 long-chain fatty acid transport protein [Neorhizobium galegae]
MTGKLICRGLLAAIAAASLHTGASAGGLERGGYNIDLLFDPSTVAAEATTTYVAPQRKARNVRDNYTTSAVYPYNGTGTGTGGGNLNGLSSSSDDTEGYWAPRLGIKAAIGDSVDCMFDYSQPWGAHSNPGRNWAGANNNIETKVESDNYAATCSYRFDLGPGQLRLIGGAFYQEVSGFKERLVQDYTNVPTSLSGVGRLDLEGHGWGWRTGIAYEIPEYAVRASLVYNSEVNLSNLTGTLDLRQANPALNGGQPYNVFGEQRTPDSLELKLQTGIAPDWLAFGSLKWTDWSQFQKIPFCVTGTVSSCTLSSPTALTTLDLGYRDGWTVTGGVGHKFNEQWSGAVSVTWDRGTSQGFGAQTDTWLFGAGVAYQPNKTVEIRLAGVLGILTGGSSGTVSLNGVTYGDDLSYNFKDDVVAAVNTSLKVRF